MITRRQLLCTAACGFGGVALRAMAAGAGTSTAGAAGSPHHRPRAKRVIFLFMAGGVSQVDSFDYKPHLEREDGRSLHFDDARTVAKTGKGAPQRVMKSLWPFRPRGQSGLWTSDLFPNVSELMDDLCLIRSMHTEGVAHGPATLFLHTGSIGFVRPSFGAWLSYGLGTENENLPAFITLSPSLGNGGPRNYAAAFLPAVHQGTPWGRAGVPASQAGIRNLTNPLLDPAQQQRQFDLLQKINREQLSQSAAAQEDTELEAVIRSYELAWRMQAGAPDVLDIGRESAETCRMYGIGQKPTDNFGRQCLMARRLAEAGVRYIQVNYSDNSNNPAWDQHSNMPQHANHARAVDKPIAGLLRDLKQRGLLEDTLVWWGGEFGRTPYAEKNGTGRDHNPGGFTVWLAGGGVKGGYAHGQTDEFGHLAVQDKVHMHDLHATILHLLGLDHRRLTYRHAGRDFRLTDVRGRVVQDLIS